MRTTTLFIAEFGPETSCDLGNGVRKLYAVSKDNAETLVREMNAPDRRVTVATMANLGVLIPNDPDATIYFHDAAIIRRKYYRPSPEQIARISD